MFSILNDAPTRANHIVGHFMDIGLSMTTKKNYVHYLFTKEKNPKKVRNHKSKPINQRYIIWNKYQIICPNQNIQKPEKISYLYQNRFTICTSTKFKWKTTKLRINQRHGNVNKHADEIKKRMCVSLWVCVFASGKVDEYSNTYRRDFMFVIFCSRGIFLNSIPQTINNRRAKTLSM